ncbi:hypothetical protein DPMN_180859 [Dreissena polymorpha]|uniref:Uncharacterized protein n=1 Tax=Dreissena polymorpha TaxID=45954 RepID=A0A9D4DCR5_DREPO|nr:hypothetical protein DPMN_180859 [Dreissena polymorpha]
MRLLKEQAERRVKEPLEVWTPRASESQSWRSCRARVSLEPAGSKGPTSINLH